MSSLWEQGRCSDSGVVSVDVSREYRGRIATGIKRPSKRVKFWQRVSDNAVAEETRMLADAADAAERVRAA